jgi:glucose/arabinose dehydrogenase
MCNFPRHGLKSLLIFAVLVLGRAAAQEPASNEAPTIPTPDPKAAELPQGYRAEVAVDRLMYPSSIAFDNEGRMYVAECGMMPGDEGRPARILRIGALEGAEREVVAEDLSAPITDLLWHDGRLFISHKGKISMLEEDKVRDLVTGLPSLGDHSNNQLAAGPDGKLYFGQGSATNSGVVGLDNFALKWPQQHPEVRETTAKDITLRGEEFETPYPRSADESKKVKTSAYQPFGMTAEAGAVVEGTVKANGTILRMDLDGSNLEVYAWGFRNPYGIGWGPDGKLYVADAGSDERGSRPIANAPEKLWLVKQDAWYGWPDFVGGIPVTDPRFMPQKGPAPQFLLKDHPPAEKPLMTLEPHSSITQIAFSPGGEFGFEGQMFLASSGDQSPFTAADKELRAGYWVKRIDPASAKAEMFFRTRPDALGPKGLEYVVTAGPKRLVDLQFSPKGDALYVVDIGPLHFVAGVEGPQPLPFPNTGVVWRISRFAAE